MAKKTTKDKTQEVVANCNQFEKVVANCDQFEELSWGLLMYSMFFLSLHSAKHINERHCSRIGQTTYTERC